jgi:hypothetical protein
LAGELADGVFWFIGHGCVPDLLACLATAFDSNPCPDSRLPVGNSSRNG